MRADRLVAVLLLLQVPLALSLARRLNRSHEAVIEASDAERRRIAADLHDGVVQDLAGVAFSLGAAARQPGRDPDDAATVRAAADQENSMLVEDYKEGGVADGA